MLYTHSAPVPKHIYTGVQADAMGTHGWLPVTWFGLVSFPGRLWGAHVMIDGGAVYRNVPLHHMASRADAAPWRACDAAAWDCYGYQFSVLEYTFLRAMSCLCRTRAGEIRGTYMFTAVPVGDGWSEAPEQSKEFTFVALDNGRYAALPTNFILFDDQSRFRTLAWPTFLQRQTETYSCEEVPGA
jgi:hypothetical protein